MIVDDTDVRAWLAEYVSAFGACGRGEADISSLLGYHAVPLLVTTDAGFFPLTTEELVIATMQQQIDGMLAAGFDHSEILDDALTVLNAVSALYRATFSRRRADGGEISRFTASYLVTDGPAGRRISVLAVHSP